MTPGLIFDMDETLYPERQFIRSGFRVVALSVERDYGIPADEALAALLRTLRQGGRPTALQSLCRTFDLPQAIIPDLIEVIRWHQPSLRLPAPSLNTLTRARADGWRLGVLTNGLPAVQARKVHALGLDALVDVVVYAQEWGSGRGKPEREPFDVVRSRLGTPAGLTVFVGDDPWCDMVGARGASLRTILLHPAGAALRAAGVDRAVTRIDDVLAVAASLICREVAHAA